jgi:hypothetical protein
MEYIREVNPEATVINVGLNNPMKGLKVSLNGSEFDIGEITGVVLNCVNAYMKSVDKNADYYYFAELPEMLESFESRIAAASSIEELEEDDEFGLGKYAINLMYDEFVKEFLTGNDEEGNKLSEGDCRTIYSAIQSGIKSAMAGASFPGWDDPELQDDDPIPVTMGNQQIYLVLDTAAENMMKSISPSQTAELSPDDFNAGKRILSKNVIREEIVENYFKPLVKNMLYEALRNHQTIDITEIQKSFADLGSAFKGITDYLTALISGNKNAKMSEADWVMLMIEEKFLLGSCIGVHPDTRGCIDKSEAIIQAYENGKTAREQTISEIRAQMAAISRMLKNAATPENMQKIVAKLVEIHEAMVNSDCAEQFREEFNKAVNQTIALIDASAAALKKQMEAVKESLDAEKIQKIAENLKYLEECLRDLPQNTINAAIQIRKITNTLKDISDMLSEAGSDKSNAILDQLKGLAKKLMAAETREDYMAIMDELQGIGTDLLNIGLTAAGLPEYEAAVDEYMYISRNTKSKLEDRMIAVEANVALLTARAINSKFSTKVTFPDGTAKVTLTLKSDILADGYVLKLNGKEVSYTEKNGSLIYEINKAKIGANYNFELTPYVFYKDGSKVVKKYGKTTKAVVTPKVTLKKAKIKSAKAGSKSVKVKWAKVKGADGYKISYKIGSKTKYVKVKDGSKTSKKIKKLTSGGKYTIKVRAYKKVDGKTYYGKWSAAKKVRVK